MLLQFMKLLIGNHVVWMLLCLFSWRLVLTLPSYLYTFCPTIFTSYGIFNAFNAFFCYFLELIALAPMMLVCGLAQCSAHFFLVSWHNVLAIWNLTCKTYFFVLPARLECSSKLFMTPNFLPLTHKSINC